MEILKTEGLCFTYKSKYQTVDAVKNVTCGFEKGKAYAIVGKSGSGKTTLLSLLAGLETPTKGKIIFDGKDLSELNGDSYRRDHAAVIYQSYNLFPLLTVIENTLYSMRLKGVKGDEAHKRAERELTAVDIKPAQYKRFPPQLSGGEQQRVAIARALASENEIILADEPTGNLDVSNTAQVVDMLLDLAHKKNRCVIVVTHDLDLAAQMDSTLTMSDGVLVSA
ncbi:MAG: ABC transporter ATP-binding protein [Clostridia bacterium]|nr:ABC transporter ATP-binding protein [Clostridia bacterium]MBR5719365.1 ABC transporter ATP-binding protein [Clostridia bacterium]